MSTQGIGALERGDRRTPQRETLSLLIEALELGPEQRADFEAAAARKSALSLERDRDTPWLHAVPPAHPLPLSLTSFVGREREVAEIVDLVREHRLVTLTGPGGIGKTRAVLDAARVLSDESPSDVRFVELATLGDAGLVVDAMVASLNLGETRNRAPFDTLLAHLEQRRVVLVVDNCEHLVAEVARTVEPLLRACAQLKILATSREPLRVPGERVYRLPALPGPPLEACVGLTAAQAAAFPSIRLFAERATSFDRSFALDDSRAPVVAEICALVEGIPLAIELAAARVTALSLPALAVNLRRHLTSLGGGARLAQSRQQTMRAAIDWSYDLLDDHERELFATLAIFAGGCTIDAAARVAFVDVDEDAAYVRVFDVLSSLVDKSLVVADVGGDVSRYRMLEPFRQYARERLVASGELALVSRRHAAAFLQAAEDFAQAARLRPDDGDVIGPARLDLDNWRAALEWCLIARNDVAMGQRIASNLRMLWNAFAAQDGRRWVRVALEAGGVQTPPERAALLERIDAMLSANLGEYEVALAAATRARSHQRALGDDLESARTEGEIGYALLRLGRPAEAEPYLHAALASARKNGAERFAVRILYLIADARAAVGDFVEAREACAQAIAIFGTDAKGDPTVTSLVTRAEIEYRAGDAEAALGLAREALHEVAALRESENAQAFAAAIHANASAYLVSLARYDEARTHACSALEIATRLNFRLEQTWALQHLAAIAALRPHPGDESPPLEDAERAARLIGFVSKRYAELGAAVEPTEQREFERVLEALGAAFSPERLAALRTRGTALGDEEAIAEAIRA